MDRRMRIGGDIILAGSFGCMKGAAMTANTSFWGKPMTIKLSDRNGSETVLRLSMQTVVALIASMTIALISGIIIWVYGIQCNVQALQNKQAAMEQVDVSHKEALAEVKTDVKEMKAVLYEVRDSQKRRGF